MWAYCREAPQIWQQFHPLMFSLYGMEWNYQYTCKALLQAAVAPFPSRKLVSEQHPSHPLLACRLAFLLLDPFVPGCIRQYCIEAKGSYTWAPSLTTFEQWSIRSLTSSILNTSALKSTIFSHPINCPEGQWEQSLRSQTYYLPSPCPAIESAAEFRAFLRCTGLHCIEGRIDCRPHVFTVLLRTSWACSI